MIKETEQSFLFRFYAYVDICCGKNKLDMNFNLEKIEKTFMQCVVQHCRCQAVNDLEQNRDQSDHTSTLNTILIYCSSLLLDQHSEFFSF